MHSYGITTTLLQYKSTFLSRYLSESRRKVPDVDERIPQNPKRTLFLPPVAKGKARSNARLQMRSARGGIFDLRCLRELFPLSMVFCTS